MQQHEILPFVPILSPTFIDHTTHEIYYLGFDLLLVRAPVRNGIADTDEAGVVPATPDDPAAGSRRAAIRAALLTASFGDDPAWAHLITEAHDQANELGVAAGLTSPEPISADRIVLLSIDAETRLPPDPGD